MFFGIYKTSDGLNIDDMLANSSLELLAILGDTPSMIAKRLCPHTWKI